MILTHLVFFEFFPGAGDGGATPTPTPTPPPAAGKSPSHGKRRVFAFDDGRTVEIRDDYHLSQIVNELMETRATEADQAKAERRSKGKRSRKIRRADEAPILAPYTPVDQTLLYQLIERMADHALTQANLLQTLDAYYRAMAEDEDLTLLLLSL